MSKKKWYESKVLWVNIIALIAITVQIVTGNELLDPEWQMSLLAFVNLALRLITGKAIAW